MLSPEKKINIMRSINTYIGISFIIFFPWFYFLAFPEIGIPSCLTHGTKIACLLPYIGILFQSHRKEIIIKKDDYCKLERG